MPLSAAALKRISDRHARYGAILVARVKALDARCDATDGLPTREAQDAALTEITREAAKLRERSRRHEARYRRLIRRILEDFQPFPPDKRP
jgi:hypothetical protein